MISSVLAVAMAAYMQPADTTRASREAFSACLRTYVERVTASRMAPAEFATAYPQECTAQQTAFRDAVIRREVASRSSRADAEESANMEIEDQRLNFRERYEMALVPAGSQTQTASAPAPAAAPAATPAATPAAAQAAAPAAAPVTASATPAAQPAAQATTPH
jgi:hypothetical protein